MIFLVYVYTILLKSFNTGFSKIEYIISATISDVPTVGIEKINATTNISTIALILNNLFISILCMFCHYSKKKKVSDRAYALPNTLMCLTFSSVILNSCPLYS